METIDYTINDDIVAIKDHSSKYKSGEVFKCIALAPCNCKCSDIMVDIGVKSANPSEKPISKCITCNSTWKNEGIWYMNARNFKKLDTLVNIDELTEILEQPLYS